MADVRGDSSELLIFPAHRWADRKLRLFACACAEHAWVTSLMSAAGGAIRVGERQADGEAGVQVRISAFREAKAAWAGAAAVSAEEHAFVAARFTLADSALAAFVAANRAASCLGDGKSAEQAWQSALFRDTFPNPFRPVAADPRWQTPAVTGLAEAIYREWAFDRMPVLADALGEAGCDDPDILSRCRGDGLHARGRWVLDLVLGKAYSAGRAGAGGTI